MVPFIRGGWRAGEVSMKHALLSKTVWAAIITGLVGTYLQLDQALGGQLPDIPGWVLLVLSALGLYGRTVAKEAVYWVKPNRG